MRARQVVRRRLAAATAVGVTMLVAACGPTVAPLDHSFGAGFLTPDGLDRYGLTVTNDVVTVAAPKTNKGINTRITFWRLADPASADQQSCATWLGPHNHMQQQGAALRIRSINGRTTAITVTSNVYYGARWIFDVHTMDSGAKQPYHLLASFDLTAVFHPAGGTSTQLTAFPWRLCAQVVGNTVSFTVWPTAQAQPTGDDPLYNGSVTLPTGWNQPGTPGWYAGHLEPGEYVKYTELATADLTPPTLAASSARPRTATAPEPTTPPRTPTWIPTAP